MPLLDLIHHKVSYLKIRKAESGALSHIVIIKK